MQRLEARRLLDAAFHPLTSGSLFQDWENPDLLLVDHDWSGVPSIEGYTLRRDGGGVSVDPRTVTGDAGRILGVTVDQTDRAIPTAGAIEFALTQAIGSSGLNTVAFQADEIDDEAYLRLRVSNTGRAVPLRIRYDLIDIDPSAASPTVNLVRQSFVLQYRIGTSGAFVNVPAGYVDNAANYAAGAVGLTHAIDATLPSDTIGAAQIELRILTTNGGGLDQLVAVDNIRVFGNDPIGGAIEFMPSAYTVREDVGTLALKLRRLGSTAGQVTVRYVLQNITAGAGSDYVAGSGVVTFLDGQSTANVNVTILDSISAEPTETFRAVLDNPAGGAGLGTNNQAVITIEDNDLVVPGIRLNELKIRPPDQQAGNEYVELGGTSNASMSGVYFVVIAGESLVAGEVRLAVPLAAYRTGTSAGLTVLASPGTAVPSGVTLIPVPAFAGEDGGLPSLRATFALLFSPLVITSETDLDVNDDGVLELPAGAVVIDSIAVKRDGSAGFAYGPVLDNLTRRVDAATRRAGINALNDANAWYFGELLDPTTGTGDGPTGVYDPRVGASSANRPAGAVLTPGGVNYQTGSTGGAVVVTNPPITLAEGSSETIELYRAGGAVGAASVRVRTLVGSAGSSDFATLDTVVNFASGEFSRSFSVTAVNDAFAEPSEWFDVQILEPLGTSLLVSNSPTRATIRPSDGPAPTNLILSEWSNNPPGTDPPYEFIELRGTPGQTLYEVYIALIEGSGNAAGKVDQFMDLSGAVIGADGFLLVKAGNGGFNPLSSQAGVFHAGVFDAPVGPGIESDTNTILLLHATPGAVVPALGADLDPANTGILNLDARFTRLDSVGWLDGDTGVNLVYSPAVLPALAAFESLDAAVRFRNDLEPHVASSWYFGKLEGSSPDSTEFGAVRSFNFPEAGRLTPGRINDPPPDIVPPQVTSVAWQFWTSPQRMIVNFSENVGVSLADSRPLRVVNESTGLPVTIEIAVEPTGDRATISFLNTGNPFNAGVLDDGSYSLQIVGSSVYDLFDNTLPADFRMDFTFITGDTDYDGIVDFDDLLVLAQNFGETSATYLQGDFNFDQVVDFADLLLLSQRFGLRIDGLEKPLARATTPADRDRVWLVTVIESVP
jgi:hypothetical protein